MSRYKWVNIFFILFFLYIIANGIAVFIHYSNPSNTEIEYRERNGLTAREYWEKNN